MKIKLSFNNGQEGFILPVPPSSVDISEPHNNERGKVLNLGSINLIGKRDLVSFQIVSFFPSTQSPFWKKTMKSPQEYVAMIKKWKNSGMPIRVIITDGGVNLAMTIDNFVYSLKEGQKVIHYTLDLTEYRFLKVPKIQVKVKKEQKNENSSKENEQKPSIPITKILPKEAQSGLKERPVLEQVPKTYVVKAGDSLWAIAHKVLGDGSRFREIYEANKEEINKMNEKYRAEIYTIYPNQKLVMP